MAITNDLPVNAQARRRAIPAMMAGNFLEYYDFTIYASLAAVLGTLFFPATDPIVSLLASLSVFAVAFLFRPIGAIVFGRMADRVGRRPTLLLVLLLMGIGTFVIGLLPVYETWGVVSPILLILLRAVQGLSMGGEFGTSASFLVEFAPKHQRGLYGASAYSSAVLGGGFALLLVFGMNFALGPDAMLDYGWRIPFIVSLPLVALGLWMRLRLEESPLYKSLQSAGETAKRPVGETFRTQWRPMLQLVGIMAGFAVASYTAMAFSVSYFISFLKYDPTLVFLTVGISYVIGSGLMLLFGSMSDRYGRKLFLMASTAATAILAHPIYLLFSTGPAGMIVGQVLLWALVALFGGAAAAAFSEMFPTRLRATGFNIAYSVGSAAISGTTALICTALIQATGNLQMPAWYLLVASAVSFVVLLFMREPSRSQLISGAPDLASGVPISTGVKGDSRA